MNYLGNMNYVALLKNMMSLMRSIGTVSPPALSAKIAIKADDKGCQKTAIYLYEWNNGETWLT